MELSKHLKVGTVGFLNTNLSCPTPASKYVSMLYWNGRQRIGWAYWQMAELPPGEVRGMNLNFVRQKRKLIPRHNLITHLSVCSKAPVASVWVAEWMLSMVQLAVLLPECQWSPSGFTVDLRFSPGEPCWRPHSYLQSEYSYVWLGSSRKRRWLMGWGCLTRLRHGVDNAKVAGLITAWAVQWSLWVLSDSEYSDAATCSTWAAKMLEYLWSPAVFCTYIFLSVNMHS